MYIYIYVYYIYRWGEPHSAGGYQVPNNRTHLLCYLCCRQLKGMKKCLSPIYVARGRRCGITWYYCHYWYLLALLIVIIRHAHTHMYIYIYESGLWIPSLSFAAQPAEKVSAVASGPLPWRFPTGRNGIWRLGCSRSGHRFRVLETHGEK